MILVLFDRLLVSTLTFSNSKCAEGAFRFNYFRND